MVRSAHRCAVGVLVRDDRVLLTHRAPTRRWFPDVWDFPGGHVEPDEGDSAALVRELREELGVTIATPTTPGIEVTFDDPDGESPVTLVFWVVRTWAGEPSNRDPAEHDELRWFLADELADLKLADPSYPALLVKLLGPCQECRQIQNG